MREIAIKKYENGMLYEVKLVKDGRLWDPYSMEDRVATKLATLRMDQLQREGFTNHIVFYKQRFFEAKLNDYKVKPFTLSMACDNAHCLGMIAKLYRDYKLYGRDEE